MVEEISNLQELDQYMEPSVIRHLIEKLCAQVMDDFKEHSEKTRIVGISFISNVPILHSEKETNMILFFKAERDTPDSSLCQVDVENVYLTDNIPDSLLDLYNVQKHKIISMSDFSN